MSKELKIHTCPDAINSLLWSELVQLSSHTSWFQTIEAYNFFNRLSFLEAFVVAVENTGVLKGVVVGYIQKDGGKIKQFFSRRAIINGGPLLADDISDDELTVLLTTVTSYVGKKAIYIETRNFNDYSSWKYVFENCGFKYEPHYDVIVDTESKDVIDANLDRNRKRNIKKAIDNGVIIEQKINDDDKKRLHTMLDQLYKEKVKTSLFPFEFFETLSNLESSRFFVVKNKEGNLIGGMVCVALSKKSLYAWYACGDDQNYRLLSPSVMVNYSGICYAAEHGFAKFDFMGAGKPDDGGYGVRDFKLKFGGKLVEYGRYKYISNKILYYIGTLGVKMLKKI